MRGSLSRAMKCFRRARRSANGMVAQVLVTVGKQIVGAQMRGKFGEQLRRYGLAVETLLQDVERLHAAVAHDQQLAVDRAGKSHRLEQVGKAPEMSSPVRE